MEKNNTTSKISLCEQLNDIGTKHRQIIKFTQFWTLLFATNMTIFRFQALQVVYMCSKSLM